MDSINRLLVIEILTVVALTVLGASGLTRPAAGVGPINVTLIGAAAVPDVQTTIYSADSCLPCRSYLKAIRREMPPDGWLVKDATEKDSSSAHVIVNKDPKAIAMNKVELLPCTIIRKKGKEVRRFHGAVTPDELATMINDIAAKKD